MDRYFHYLRHILGLTVDESRALSTILARYNGYLDYRRVEGFRVLPPSSDRRCGYIKECSIDSKCYKRHHRTFVKCERKAVIAVIMSYGDKYFSVYLCEKHFRRFLENVVDRLIDRVNELYSRVMKHVFERNALYGIDLDGIEVVFSEADQSK